MSQYEYYEFQAVDRRLNAQEMQRLRASSSRAQITPTSFINEYHFGSFKGNADLWMENYFDGYIYNSHWGSRVFMLAFPAEMLPPESIKPYCSRGSFSVREKDGRVILKFTWHDENYENWIQSEESLSPLLPLREEIAGGDRRGLYIGWLLSLQKGECEERKTEPLIPPNLSALTPALKSLVDFLRVDQNLLDVASEGSASVQPPEKDQRAVAAWVSALPVSEKDSVLARMLDGEPDRVAMELRARFCKTLRQSPAASLAPRRTAGKLLEAAETLREKREQQSTRAAAAERARQQELAAQARKRHLESLVGRESEIWAKVDGLIAVKQSKSYDEAVQHLKDLKDLTAQATRQGDFQNRIRSIRSAHPAKRGFLDRLQREGL